MQTIYKKLYDFCCKHAFHIVMLLLLAVSVMIRWTLAPNTFLSGDYNTFYKPWIEQYRTDGIVSCLRQGIGDYYVPFNLLYALFSLLPVEPWVPLSIFFCAMEYISVYYIYKLLRLIGEKTGMAQSGNYGKLALFVAVATLYLPHVILNSSLWKQCDSIYTMFTFASLYYLLKEKHTLAFVLLSVGFCFKLQMIFVLPFFIIAYVCFHKFTFFQFFQIPAWYIAFGVPAIACGRRWQDVYKTYLGQMGQEDAMTINTPGFYLLGLNDYYGLYRAAILTTIAIFVIIAYYSFMQKDKLDLKRVFQLTGLCIWTCYMFLPAMHERYDYTAIIFVFVYVLMFRRKYLWVPISMMICSICTYSNALLYGSPIPLWICAIAYFAAYIGYCYDYFKGLR